MQALRLEQRLPTLASVGLLLLLTYGLAALTWRLVPQGGGGEAALLQPVPVMPSPQRVSPSPAVAAQITQWHLFGEVIKEPVTPLASSVPAPDTRLNLKLLGVFASKEARRARAIIADARGEEDAYGIGDQVPGGAKVNAIFKDHVLLELGGRLETLRLPESTEPGEGGLLEGGGVASVTYGGAPPVPPATMPAPLMSSAGETGALLRQYRDQLINDPQSVMGLLRTEPVSEAGKLVGFRILPGRDRMLLRKFGLNSGDVVTSVNGVPMDNPVKALEVLRDLASAEQLTVDIRRNGAPQSFVFRIDQ